MQNQDRKELVIREALTSTRMEGSVNQSEIEQNIRCLLNGKITIAQRIHEVRKNQMSFGDLYGRAEYTLSFSALDGALLIPATIQATQRVTDLLRQIFQEAIHFDHSKSNL